MLRVLLLTLITATVLGAFSLQTPAHALEMTLGDPPAASRAESTSPVDQAPPSSAAVKRSGLSPQDRLLAYYRAAWNTTDPLVEEASMWQHFVTTGYQPHAFKDPKELALAKALLSWERSNWIPPADLQVVSVRQWSPQCARVDFINKKNPAHTGWAYLKQGRFPLMPPTTGSAATITVSTNQPSPTPEPTLEAGWRVELIGHKKTETLVLDPKQPNMKGKSSFSSSFSLQNATSLPDACSTHDPQAPKKEGSAGHASGNK